MLNVSEYELHLDTLEELRKSKIENRKLLCEIDLLHKQIRTLKESHTQTVDSIITGFNLMYDAVLKERNEYSKQLTLCMLEAEQQKSSENENHTA